MLPAAAPHQLVGHSPFDPHSLGSLQNLPLTQSIVGTIGSLHLQMLPPIPVWKHHPPGQSWLVWQFVLSMHVSWGSGVVRGLMLHEQSFPEPPGPNSGRQIPPLQSESDWHFVHMLHLHMHLWLSKGINVVYNCLSF